MRIVTFPSSREPRPPESWAAELEAALKGERTGPAADSWRELREDVRALAPPMAPEVEHQLRARIAEEAGHRSRSDRAPCGAGALPQRAPSRWPARSPPPSSLPGRGRPP